MKTNESLENYLEAILLISKTGYVRSIDIARHLNFSKPSVSVAVKNLKEKNLITLDENGHISLTETGLKIANITLEKHQMLTDILIKLGVNEEIAANDACGIEHQLSDESFNAIKKFYEANFK